MLSQVTRLVAAFDTNYINDDIITIEGSTTNPTKGTIVNDKLRYRLDGDDCIAEYHYNQSTSGTVGSGVYLFSLPTDIEFDDSYTFDTSVVTSDTITNGSNICVNGYITGGTFITNIKVIPYDSKRFKLFGMSTLK